MSSREHILAVPKAVLGLRIAQLIVAVVILGLAGYGITYYAFDGDSLMLFTAIATMISVVYILVAELAAPAAYNYWAILGLDIFNIVFWIISMSLLASEIAAFTWVVDDSCTYYYGYCVKKRDLSARSTTTLYTYRNALAAASGLGGLEFILFAITLGIFASALHRHRNAGGHCTVGGAANAPTAPVTNEPKGAELQNVGQQPVYYPPPSEQPISA